MAAARPSARSLPRAPPVRSAAGPPSRAPPVAKSVYDAYRDEQEAMVARKDSKGAVDAYKGQSNSEKVCSSLTVLYASSAGLAPQLED
jgi:hypothetical protein